MHKKEKVTKLIAVYARVSTLHQEEEGTIKTQLSAIHERVKEEKYSVVKEYIDDGWSGDILARPQLDKLRQDAMTKDRVWEAVLIYDPDRLARSLADATQYSNDNWSHLGEYSSAESDRTAALRTTATSGSLWQDWLR